jgi:hypothetical protein
VVDKFKSIDIKVDGETIRAPIFNDLTIRSIGNEMDSVAAQMGYWGVVLAAASEDFAAADAVYRNWRATTTNALLDADPKLAEWKIKAKIEADSMFLTLKNKIAKAERNVIILEKVVDAYSKKANQLQSRGANMRAEMEKTGIYTRASEGDSDGDDDAAGGARVAKVRGLIGRRKRGEDTSNE